MATRSGSGATLLGLLICHSLLQVAAVSAPLTQVELKASEKFFTAKEDGSFGSLEKTYQAVRSFEVMGKGAPSLPKVCSWLPKGAGSPPSSAQAAYFAVRIAGILKCEDAAKVAQEAEPVLVAAAEGSRDLLSLYYSLTGLAYIKEKGWTSEGASYRQALAKALDSLKGLIKSDGTWRYEAGSAQSSVKAAGLGLETAAALVSFGAVSGSSEVDALRTAASRLFAIAANEDGMPFLLPEGPGDDASGGSSTVATTSAAAKGAVALASALGEASDVAEPLIDAAYLLLEAVPNSASEAFYQLDGLAVLNDNSVVVPLVATMPSKISVESPEVKVTVTTVLGDAASPITVKAAGEGKSDGKVCTKLSDTTWLMDTVAKIGHYAFPIQVESPDAKYTAPESNILSVRVTGRISVTDVKLAVFDADSTRPESEASLVFGESTPASLSATHLQKLELSFKLTSPSGEPFTPQEVLVRFGHESGIDHHYVAKPNEGVFSLKLDFLEMMEKLYYLSGVYALELTVGDSLMENSFVWKLAEVDLDLPDAPDSAPKPPSQAVSLYSRFGPKPEILHVFRASEKRPPLAVSYLFMGLSLLPLIGLIAGLGSLGVNLKAFPSSGLPSVAAIAFHGGLAAILLLYAFFWIKLNLFFTLKALVVLALLTAIPGHFTLSYLANSSSKLKTS